LIATPGRYDDQCRADRKRNESGKDETICVAPGVGHLRSQFAFKLRDLLRAERAEVHHLVVRIDHDCFDLRERLARLDPMYRRWYLGRRSDRRRRTGRW
jgi:hypothetical protein